MRQPGTKLATPASRAVNHIGFLDGVRGVAIMLVVTYHALSAGCNGMGQLHWRRFLRDFQDTPPSFLPFLPMTLGWLGVAVFFAASGFCIHLSYEKSSRKEFKPFFVRRFFRIYPPYLVALCFFALLFPDTRLKMDSLQDIAQFWSHFLMVHHINVRLFYGINPSFWSIVIEAQLYLIYPLLLLLARRYGWAIALLVAGLAEVSLRGAACLCYIPDWLHFSPLYYWLSWAIGAKLADDYLNGRPLFMAQCPFWIWPALTLLSDFFRPLSEFTFLFAALTTAKYISYRLSRPIIPDPQLRIPLTILAKIGVISYSVYLLNQPLLNAFSHYLQGATAAYHVSHLCIFLCLLGFCGVILILSGIFYRFVELPSIELGKRVLERISPKDVHPERANGSIT